MKNLLLTIAAIAFSFTISFAQDPDVGGTAFTGVGPGNSSAPFLPNQNVKFEISAGSLAGTLTFPAPAGVPFTTLITVKKLKNVTVTASTPNYFTYTLVQTKFGVNDKEYIILLTQVAQMFQYDYTIFTINGTVEAATNGLVEYQANGNPGGFISTNQGQVAPSANAPINGTPLPVTLLSFDAKKSESGTASLLTWETGDERSSDRFETERSANGKTFEQLGTVAAAGNSDDNNTYSFTDAVPLQGANYYRLKMYDQDGSFKYSQTRVLNFDKAHQVTLHPNPATTQVEVDGVEAGMKAILSSATGQQIAVYTIDGSSLVIPTASLVPGFYHVQIRSASGALVSTTKLMKQ